MLPLRHPLAVARAVLTLQELADGRLLFGAGLGWLREEFEALGVPFAGRAARFEESLDILRKAWAGGAFEHHGAVYDFGPVELTAQQARIPLILGGNTAPALRRAALRADGWFASGTPSLAEAVDLMARLDAAQAAAGRAVPLTTYVRACAGRRHRPLRGSRLQPGGLLGARAVPAGARPVGPARRRGRRARRDRGSAAMTATPPRRHAERRGVRRGGQELAGGAGAGRRG